MTILKRLTVCKRRCSGKKICSSRWRNVYQDFTGLDHIANGRQTAEDRRRTFRLIERLPDLIVELPDGNREITEQGCLELLAMPRPSHLTELHVRAMCDHFEQLMNSDTDMGVGGGATVSLELLVNELQGIINRNWRTTTDAVDRILPQLIAGERSAVGTGPSRQSFLLD